MNTAHPRPASAPSVAGAVRRIGSVKYLNARPLIDGLEGQTDPLVQFDVPSRLLSELETGLVDVALCPVIDYFRSQVELDILPVGAIGSLARTLTVCLYSQVPFDRIEQVHTDTDSHTSIVLLRILLSKLHGLTPQFVDYSAAPPTAAAAPPATMLLIGDKVVTSSPSETDYPYQIDLGEAWHELTGLPFVFAVWMARTGNDVGDLPALLDQTRRNNAKRIDQIVARHAAEHGWPEELAMKYLSEYLCYDIGAAQLQAIAQFARMAYELNLIDTDSPLRVRR